MNTRVCKICNIEKELNEDNFSIRKDKGRFTFRWQCKPCRVNISTKYTEDHKEARIAYNKKYYKANKEKDNERSKIYRKNHIKELKQYFNEYVKQKRQNDPSFKLRMDVSTLIRRALKNSFSSKNGQSCFKYLNYTKQQLLKYLESQFEPWMTWNNHGKYNSKTWKDNDPTTWTWQIDHIIPQSDLPYTSMKDINFKKCWSLTNLRPLSAKQNFLDGIYRKRHTT